MKVDAINVSILKILQQNARMSNAEIGRRVGISSPAVGERIKKWKTQVLLTNTKLWYHIKKQVIN